MRRILVLLSIMAVALTFAAQGQDEQLGPTRGDLWSQSQAFAVGPLDIECVTACAVPFHGALGLGVDFGARFVAQRVFNVPAEHLADVGLAASIGWGLGREASSFFAASDVGLDGEEGFVSASSQRLDALLDFGEHIMPSVIRYVDERYGRIAAIVVGVGFAGLDYYLVDQRDLR